MAALQLQRSACRTIRMCIGFPGRCDGSRPSADAAQLPPPSRPAPARSADGWPSTSRRSCGSTRPEPRPDTGTGRCRHIGDVGDPELVRPGRAEVAVHQVRRRSCLLVAPGRHRPAIPVTGTDQASLPHQPRNPFAAVLLAMPLQFGMDAGRSIRLARAGVHRAHSLQQRRVSRGMDRRRAVNPGVVARLGHAEHARHGGKWEAGLVGAHEPEEPDGTAPVSRANQAAAFDKISRSTRSCLFSRRKRATHLVQTPLNQRPPPPVGPLACRPQPPTRRSTAQWAQTPGRDPREIVQHEPGQPSGGGTQANTADASWASGAPLVKASGCPRNRVNPSTARRWRRPIGRH